MRTVYIAIGYNVDKEPVKYGAERLSFGAAVDDMTKMMYEKDCYLYKVETFFMPEVDWNYYIKDSITEE